jgi:hypothetical protein
MKVGKPGYNRRTAKKKSGLKESQKSLDKWTKEDWGTKSGNPSTQGKKATGERYLPKAARAALTPSEYAATTAAKRKGRAAGKQYVAQPKDIANKTAKYRSAKKGGKIGKSKYGKAPHNRIY